MRRRHGGSRAVPGSMRCPAALGDPSQPGCRAGTILGIRGAAVARHLQCHAAPQPRRWIVVVLHAPCGLGARGRVNALISVIETRSESGATLPTAFQPWSSAVDSAGGASRRGRASKEPCMLNPNPNPPRKPAPREPAAGQRHSSRGRRARPGPPGFTYEVQLLGGEAGRRLAQEQTEAVAAVLAWLAAHPPTPPAATGSAATRRRRHARRAEHGDASRDAASRAEPSRASGWEHAAGDGRQRG
jgi:hypothetical protein